MTGVVRYFFVGATAAAIDIGLFALFAGLLGYPYLVVAFFTFVLATYVNYELSVRFVFASGVRFARREELALVFVVSAIGLAVNQTMLYVGVALLGAPLVPAKVFATATVFAWNYLARSRFVFRRPR